MQDKQLLIFTDLDGSLLDHYSYNHTPANATLEQLKQSEVPVIFASSKTRSELEALRRELNNIEPFIVENGAAIFIPINYFSQQPPGTEERDGYWVKEFVAVRKHWLSLLKKLNTDFSGCYTSFAEAGVEGIMAMTGLDKLSASRAAEKEYSEPLQWHGSHAEMDAFIQRLQSLGARVLQGGRFLHISGDCDKGAALQWLSKQYAQHYSAITTLAIGDSNNDIAMLEAAEHALIIRSPAHEPPQLSHRHASYISDDYGPAGWAKEVEKIIKALNINLTHKD